ncbi:nucleotidyltransferase family protein [halophilic archaeon]|nr:nucleotidyltransferase family protein [halophilic archaeon]
MKISTGALTDGGPTVGGILLAAGQSKRFEGENKLLATVKGEPIVRRSAWSLLCASLADICVVIGHDDKAVRDALSGFGMSFCYNEDYSEGQSTSVDTGIRFAKEIGWDAVVFALGDMPFVDSGTIDILTDTYMARTTTIVAAAYEGKRGNPVLFDKRHFDTLAAVTGDQGGRHLIEEHEDSILVETDDPGVIQDIDNRNDLQQYTS